jgi:ATP-dependent DNA ligase
MPVLSFIEPCLPSPADRLPDGPDWVHEIKHDGYRLMARRDFFLDKTRPPGTDRTPLR